MIAHCRRLAACSSLVILLTAAAPDAPRRALPAEVVIRWQAGTGSIPSAVEVEGIDPTDLTALSALSHVKPAPFLWSDVFKVSVAQDTDSGPEDAAKRPAILGTYRVVDGRLRFEPRFPIEPGLKHRAVFRPSLLPIESYKAEKDVVAEFTRPLPPPPPPTVVVRVDPTSDLLPENLLKFYLHFSAPMSRGEVYDRVALLDDAGRKLDVPFLELGEELWDPDGTRLTLLLDPGRIKRGLKPREDLGPILVPGKSYTLVVDRAWPDAAGHPLRETYRKRFRTGPTDETQPDPKTWKIGAPPAGTSDALSLTFPEPLDRAMLSHALTVTDDQGKEVPGRVEVEPAATRWSFQPDRPWAVGTYQVVVDAKLEDLVGNSIARPFEVDILRPVTQRIATATVSIPIEVRERPAP